ncbi:MAG TPA: VOC family protein [Chitinophagaceae bacterium]|nr:VOC family protein [Chitinophagaceae bacterium]
MKERRGFAPMLIIKDGIAAVKFYQEAFGAVELKRYPNDDGTIHVSELAIEGNIFLIREENAQRGHFDAGMINGTTVLIGIFVGDPYAVQQQALNAGAVEIRAVKDHEETGYREGNVKDPFGHTWLILKKYMEQ